LKQGEDIVSHAISDSESHHASVTKILGILGDEVQDLGRTVETLQTILSPALLQIAADPACMKHAQTLDVLAQRLTALGRFVSSLEHSVPREWWLDFAAALRGVTLSDLAWRLKGKTAPEPTHEAGAVDLF
jgi:hypothetical protein